MTIAFDSLGLAPSLLDAVKQLGFTAPTPVQAQVIPAALQGGDWMVSSQTGSGKTAAFLLPALQAIIAANPGGKPTPGRTEPRVIVLCPTRELAQQVASDAIDLVRGTRGVRIATVVGGMPYGKQIQLLKGAQLVVATPGRLLDLVDRRAVRLDEVKLLVVDEADRMLDLGFADDLQAIHEFCATRDQTMMFSATFAPRIMDLAMRVMREPGRIELASAHDRHENIAQTLHWADNYEHKMKLLDHLLADTALEQAVVFASTQIQSEEIADGLRARGVSASALHGAMPQSVRNRRLDALRSGHTRILVATDVAARGIDVPTISHVINFGLPMKAEDYVHRIGRTGRAGRSGIAITLAEHRERMKIRAIEHFTRQTLEASTIAGLEPREAPRPRSGGPRRDFGGKRFGNGAPAGGGGWGPKRFEGKPRFEGQGRPEGGRFDGAPRFEGPQGFDRAPRFEGRPQGGGFGEGSAPRREWQPRPDQGARPEGQQRPWQPRGDFAGKGPQRPWQAREGAGAGAPRQQQGWQPRAEQAPGAQARPWQNRGEQGFNAAGPGRPGPRGNAGGPRKPQGGYAPGPGRRAWNGDR